MITKPMLAARCTTEDLANLKYPVGITNKVDGIRCLIINGKAVSRTFKPIPNVHVRAVLEKYMPEGMDMELCAGVNFQDSTGNIMRHEGWTDIDVWVIDYVSGALKEPYAMRMAKAAQYAEDHWAHKEQLPFHYHILMPVEVSSLTELQVQERKALAAGFEGIMVRDLYGPYKCGRSTLKEGGLIKVKRFEDQEAKVLAVEPLYHNENDAEKDNFGRTKRSSAQENMVADALLGSLTVKGVGGFYHGVKFSVGSGFTHEQRVSWWKDRKELVGKLVKVKYFPTGVKVAPRFPIFLGWRHPDDTDTK